MQAIEDELTPFGFVTGGDSNDAETFVEDGDRWSVVNQSSNW